MAAVDVNAIVEDGFKTVFSNLAANGDGVKLRSEGYEPDSGNPPCVFVMPQDDQTAVISRASHILTFKVIVLVPSVLGPTRARHELSAWYAAIDDALDDDTTLNGQVSGVLDVRIESGEFFGSWTIGGQPYPCLIATVDVITG